MPRRQRLHRGHVMPRLYREAPLNSIWEGAGNVVVPDVLRAIGRAPGRRGVARRDPSAWAATAASARFGPAGESLATAATQARGRIWSDGGAGASAPAGRSTPRPPSPTRSAPRESGGRGRARLRHAPVESRPPRDRGTRGTHDVGLTDADVSVVRARAMTGPYSPPAGESKKVNVGWDDIDVAPRMRRHAEVRHRNGH